MNRFPINSVLMMIMAISMTVAMAVLELWFAAVIWGICIGLAFGTFMEDLFYWSVKRKSGKY